MVDISSDGNGGYDITANVQRKHVRRYWWVPMVLAVAGIGGSGYTIRDVVFASHDNSIAVRYLARQDSLLGEKDKQLEAEIGVLHTTLDVVTQTQVKTVTRLDGLTDVLRHTNELLEQARYK